MAAMWSSSGASTTVTTAPVIFDKREVAIGALDTGEFLSTT